MYEAFLKELDENDARIGVNKIDTLFYKNGTCTRSFENWESINTLSQEIGYHSEFQRTVVEEIENLKD